MMRYKPLGTCWQLDDSYEMVSRGRVLNCEEKIKLHEIRILLVVITKCTKHIHTFDLALVVQLKSENRNISLNLEGYDRLFFTKTNNRILIGR